jgi:hypothetical protein
MQGRNLASTEREISYSLSATKVAMNIATKVKGYYQLKVNDVFNSYEFLQDDGMGVAKIIVSLSNISDQITKVKIEAMNLTASETLQISDGKLASMISEFEDFLSQALTGKLILKPISEIQPNNQPQASGGSYMGCVIFIIIALAFLLYVFS